LKDAIYNPGKWIKWIIIGGKKMAVQDGVMEINKKKRILILAANPKTTPRLRLDEEVREIEEGLQRAKHRERFDIRSKWAVRFRDIRRALLDYEPHIVHFVGHGEKKGIALEDESGFAKFLSVKALSGLFKLLPQIECVILSACYSASHTSAINEHIDYVIGMPKAIEDEAAIEFSVGFYDALGAGKSVEKAFEFGRSAVLDLPHHLIPILKKRKSIKKRTNGEGEKIEEENKTPGNSSKDSTNTKQIVNIENLGTFINNF
jgi:hypothetical protein